MWSCLPGQRVNSRRAGRDNLELNCCAVVESSDGSHKEQVGVGAYIKMCVRLFFFNHSAGSVALTDGSVARSVDHVVGGPLADHVVDARGTNLHMERAVAERYSEAKRYGQRREGCSGELSAGRNKLVEHLAEHGGAVTEEETLRVGVAVHGSVVVTAEDSSVGRRCGVAEVDWLAEGVRECPGLVLSRHAVIEHGSSTIKCSKRSCSD